MDRPRRTDEGAGVGGVAISVASCVSVSAAGPIDPAPARNITRECHPQASKCPFYLALIIPASQDTLRSPFTHPVLSYYYYSTVYGTAAYCGSGCHTTPVWSISPSTAEGLSVVYDRLAHRVTCRFRGPTAISTLFLTQPLVPCPPPSPPRVMPT